jgi:hypothetical protein
MSMSKRTQGCNGLHNKHISQIKHGIFLPQQIKAEISRQIYAPYPMNYANFDLISQAIHSAEWLS